MARDSIQNFGQLFRNESSTPTSSQVVNVGLPGVFQLGDPLEGLPPEARDKLYKLQERRDAARVLTRASADAEQETRLAILRHQNRIKELTLPRGLDGYNLDATAPQVAAEQKALDAKQAELARQSTIHEARNATWQITAELIRSVEAVVANPPGGCVARMRHDDPPELKKNEDVLAAIERHRRRGRELQADLNRIRCSPYPLAVRKAAMRGQIEALAEVGRPNASSSIEHAQPISWPLKRHQFLVYNAEPGAAVFPELIDILGFSAWLFKDELIAKLDAELAECAADDCAMTHEARQIAEAQVLGDLLEIEHTECRLIELAQQQGFPVEFRVDCDPRAVLSIEWVIAPPREPQDSDGRYGVIDHAGPRR